MNSDNPDDLISRMTDEELTELLASFADETYIERLIGDVDIELPNGTILKNQKLIRKEMLKSASLDSTLEYQFYARATEDDEDNEHYLGTYKGDNLIIKAKEQK